MSGGLDGSWYRVADLAPRLRAHAQMHRHRYRDRIWYLLQDHHTGRYVRLSPSAHLMLGLMDGTRTLRQIWELAGARLGARRPTRAELLRLLTQLHHGDLLQSALPPDMAELGRRADRQGRGRLLSWVRNPMALRLPLIDPDRMLARTAPALRWIDPRVALLGWLALIGTGLVLAAMHWQALTGNLLDRALSTENVLLLALIYPVAKTLHELGHAYAVALCGGEVHEIGVMLLVLFPVPYVDASSSSGFADHWRRMVVAAAGVMVELALAAVALIAWTWLPPGLPRAAAFSTVLLCGVSTLVFNANPLLRFDGYYVLCDLLQMPNLDTRAKRYLMYLLQRRAFGMHGVESPVESAGEAKWLALYGLIAFVYRLGVTVGVSLLVAGKLFAIGAALAVWAAVQMFALPLLRGLRWLMAGSALGRQRARAQAVTFGGLAVLAALLFAVPLPYATIDQGVVWIPEEAVLRAGADGFVRDVLVPRDAEVAAGQTLLVLDDPVAQAQVDVYAAQLAVAQGRLRQIDMVDRAQAGLERQHVARAAALLAYAERRRGDLALLAGRAGRLVLADPARLVGRFVHKGDLIGYVIGADDLRLHVVVPEDEIDLVRKRTRFVQVRLTETIGTALPASIVRETPSALEHAPAPALAADGGGPMLLDPTSPNRDRPLDRFYEVELRLDDGPATGLIGGRVYARFDLGREAIAWRLLRAARQTLRRVFDV